MGVAILVILKKTAVLGRMQNELRKETNVL